MQKAKIKPDQLVIEGIVLPLNLESLKHFHSDMGMYLPSIERHTIVSFWMGFIWALRIGKNPFTDLISQHVQHRYRFKCYATGWPNQIERLAEKLNKNWVDTYLQVSAEVLSQIDSTK
ncbi:hypothetical protein BH11PLA2_BH11PLA2_50110 [soil metagenome]